MKNLSLSAIARACGSNLINGSDILNKEVDSVVIDSRMVEESSLFVATKGERVDGHSFIGKAIDQGAIAVVCEVPPTENDGKSIPYILVEDSFEALKKIAMYYRSTLEIPIISIVGSVGKTSTKEMVASVLSQKYNVLKTQGNYNNEIGLPLTILRIKEEHEVAVLELGINQFGEMTRLGEIAKPNYVVMTNIADCHLEFLHNREGVLKAKSEILPFVLEGGKVILNGDDILLRRIYDMTNELSFDCESYGLNLENTITAKDISNKGLLGSTCEFLIGEDKLNVDIRIPGNHAVYNAMAAVLVAKSLGLNNVEIENGILKARTIQGRSNIIETEDYIVIDDCYNANPTSMKTAIDMLCLSNTRKIAVLGDMGELGENEVELHKEVGEYVANSDVDICVCIGGLSRSIAEAVIESEDTNCEAKYMLNIQEFKMNAHNLINEGDSILIKASHSMGFNEIVEFLKNAELFSVK